MNVIIVLIDFVDCFPSTSCLVMDTIIKITNAKFCHPQLDLTRRSTVISEFLNIIVDA